MKISTNRTAQYFACWATTLSVLLLLSCTSKNDGQRIDNFPMYGQPEIPRPEILKKADEDFIQQATAALGNRELASKAWAAKAEQYMKEGNLDYAMRRYNQSWLLDPNYYLPYWGFGQVLTTRGQPTDAIEHFERAKQLIDDEYQKPALLSDTGSAYSMAANQTPKGNPEERAHYFVLANNNFQESVNLDSKYSIVWFFWSRSLYFEERYPESWEKLKKARSLGTTIPISFLKALGEKLPEPN